MNDIALVKVNDHKNMNFYSFATKYCSHHFPNDYPIYDSFVEKMLMYFRDKDKFAKFKKNDLKNYEKYPDVLREFKKFYNLENFTLKEIDRYLWQVGKQHFTKDYKRKKG